MKKIYKVTMVLAFIVVFPFSTFAEDIYIDSGQILGNSNSEDVVLGDVDGDGDLDAFVANYNHANRVWLNDGSGLFTDSGQVLGNSQSIELAMGDVDGDGDLDAFVVNYGGQANKVWINDGSGGFTDSGQTLGSSLSLGVDMGDVDGDGDLDAFTTNYSGQSNIVWLNNGSGVFTDSGQTLGNSNSYNVALDDVDGDGDLDAFVANGDPSANTNKVWLNNGSGVFTDSGQALGNSNSIDVTLCDVDGDGDLDAFVSNDGQANKVWINDGSGVFTDSGQALGNSYSRGLVSGDMDGDGDLDVFVANWFNNANIVWFNDGSGVFTSGQALGSSGSLGVTLGDVDGDGDLDAFVANYPGQANRVYFNNTNPICQDDATCDDGLYCNGSETCDTVNGCQAGTAPDCDDGVSCTADSCNETSDQCVNTANDANCDNGQFCDGAEICDVVLDCKAGTPPTIDDGIGCTDDSCDEVNDIIVNAVNDAYCDDGQNQLCDKCDPENTTADVDGCVVDISGCINFDIPVGRDIAIPWFDFSIWFEEVLSAGTTTVQDNLDNPGAFPEMFSLCGNYFDITLTDVVYHGAIEICAPYNPSLVQQGDNVYLMHFVNGQWKALDSTVGTNPDRVCGLTTSLSPFAPAATPCADADMDGFFDQVGCGTAVDCNDNNPAINPRAAEVCGDGLDNNCDGEIDEGCECIPSEEVCDGLDNNCNGEIDENLPNDVHDGDVNGDSNITPQDALMAFQHYLGLTTLNECQQSQANVNGDDSITPADALCVFQKYLGLPSCLD